MDKWFYLLAIITIVALTYLAYKHPKRYERLFNPLYIIIFMVYACLSIWNTGTTFSLLMLNPFIKEGKIEQAKATIESLQIPWIPLHTIVWFLFIYLLFLSFLPRLLEKRRKKQH